MARQTKNQKVEQLKDAPETLHEHPFYGFQLDADQRHYVDSIWDRNKLIVGVDAKAGSGKTTLAFAVANLLYEYGFYKNIIYVVSPYGESKQGFLPGDITEKSEVYFEPIYQAIIKCNLFPDRVIYNESLTARTDKVESCGYVKCLTHTYLRGTNFEDAIVILDESQNYSFDDLKKTLTRANDNCKIILIGHSKQRDTNDNSSGFEKYLEYYRQMEESGETKVAICKLTKNYRGWISSTADELVG